MDKKYAELCVCVCVCPCMGNIYTVSVFVFNPKVGVAYTGKLCAYVCMCLCVYKLYIFFPLVFSPMPIAGQ